MKNKYINDLKLHIFETYYFDEHKSFPKNQKSFSINPKKPIKPPKKNTGLRFFKAGFLPTP